MKKVVVDPHVFVKRSPWMQRIADLVRSGHVHYIQGDLPVEKIPHLYEKFDRLYDCGLNKLQASRLRKSGRASSRLLMLYQAEHENVRWILLRTDGELSPAAVSSRESWLNALDDRISYQYFEMVRMPKPGQIRPAFTWRYSRSSEDMIRSQIILMIRAKYDKNLQMLIANIFHSPKFAGIRLQIKGFRDLIVAEWKRSRSVANKFPDLPSVIGYHGRLKDKSVKASTLLKLDKI